MSFGAVAPVYFGNRIGQPRILELDPGVRRDDGKSGGNNARSCIRAIVIPANAGIQVPLVIVRYSNRHTTPCSLGAETEHSLHSCRGKSEIA